MSNYQRIDTIQVIDTPDKAFNIVVERTEDGVSIRVYPRSHDGDLWDSPADTLEVLADPLYGLPPDSR